MRFLLLCHLVSSCVESLIFNLFPFTYFPLPSENTEYSLKLFIFLSTNYIICIISGLIFIDFSPH